ncbi:MAG: CRISPR-associated protein Cas4 [Magnetococcales bacterium]|nr:CRISPR-associated protein Cas4 [Magnetococcales bacterium]
MEEDIRYAPLSALQHLVYCERQCALIHLERVWLDNRLTAEGNVLHEKTHQEGVESRPGIGIARGLQVVSQTCRLMGQCDVVEFHGRRGRGGGAPRWESVQPVEYKRGRPKSHEADRVQLCAQALCLEEMLAMPVTAGALFYGEPRRRTPVAFTPELRATTLAAVDRLHRLLDGEITPPAVYRAALCRGCSLLDVCLPRRRETPGRVSIWFGETLQHLLEEG